MCLNKQQKEKIRQICQDHFSQCSDHLDSIDLRSLLSPSNVLWAMLESGSGIPYKIFCALLKKEFCDHSHIEAISSIITQIVHSSDQTEKELAQLVVYVKDTYREYASKFEDELEDKANYFSMIILSHYLDEKGHVDWVKILSESYSNTRIGMVT